MCGVVLTPVMLTVGAGGLVARLKPDTDIPVPNGFTKAIERMRKGQQDRENLAKAYENLGKGSVDKKVRCSLCSVLCACGAIFKLVLVLGVRLVTSSLHAHLPALYLFALTGGGA